MVLQYNYVTLQKKKRAGAGQEYFKMCSDFNLMIVLTCPVGTERLEKVVTKKAESCICSIAVTKHTRGLLSKSYQ